MKIFSDEPFRLTATGVGSSKSLEGTFVHLPSYSAGSGWTDVDATAACDALLIIGMSGIILTYSSSWTLYRTRAARVTQLLVDRWMKLYSGVFLIRTFSFHLRQIKRVRFDKSERGEIPDGLQVFMIRSAGGHGGKYAVFGDKGSGGHDIEPLSCKDVAEFQ